MVDRREAAVDDRAGGHLQDHRAHRLVEVREPPLPLGRCEQGRQDPRTAGSSATAIVVMVPPKPSARAASRMFQTSG